MQVRQETGSGRCARGDGQITRDRVVVVITSLFQKVEEVLAGNVLE